MSMIVGASNLGLLYTSAGVSALTRIRGQFDQTGTATGRLAMDNPNLQVLLHAHGCHVGTALLVLKGVLGLRVSGTGCCI